MLNAVVLAAGKGTRMHSNKAKTMHKILDKPILEHVYDTLDKLQCKNIVCVVGHGREEIEDYFSDRLTYAIQQPQLGTAHAVMQAISLKEKEGKTLIVNGDCPLIQKETYQKMIEMAEQYDLVLMTTKLDNPASYGRIVRNNDSVEAIIEYKDADEQTRAIKEVNVGIYCIDNQLLWKYIGEIDNHNAQNEYYITDIVKVFKKHGLKVGACCFDDFNQLQGINSRLELLNASKWLQKKTNEYWMNNGVTIIDPDSTYISTDAVLSIDTIIYPNVRIEGKTVIGQNNIIEESSCIINSKIGDNNHIIASRITDSEVGSNVTVGPNAHLRNNCKIGDDCRIGNYVEMKNTTFGKGSKCAHLTYVGDSTVGQNCNFGCGVVTVNYDGKNKHRCTIGNHVFVGSNVNLIAPVTIGDYAVLAAGSTVTDDVEEKDMAIARCRQQVKKGYGFKYLNK